MRPTDHLRAVRLMLAVSLACTWLPAAPARAADWAEGAVDADVLAGDGHTWAPARAFAPAQVAAPGPGGGINIRMAAEFEHQSALLLGAGEMVRRYPRLFTSVVRRLHGHVPLIGVIATDVEHQIALRLLARAALPAHAVRWARTTARTVWIRDYGPLFVRMADGSAVVVDVRSTRNDVPWPVALSVPGQLALSMRLPVLPSDLDLQGGNVLTNGEGLFVTTEAIMHPNAAAGLSRRQVCDRLAARLGAREWLCLDPLQNEPTGHVDMFVTFLAPNVAVVAQCDPNVDPVNARILDRAATALSHQATSRGAMQVHRVPLPLFHDGIWRSYTNLVLANGVALVPTYADVNPRQQLDVLALYRRLLPGWRVVRIPADDIIRLGGALHCVTMNVPGYVKVRPPAAALRPGDGAAQRRLGPEYDAIKQAVPRRGHSRAETSGHPSLQTSHRAQSPPRKPGRHVRSSLGIIRDERSWLEWLPHRLNPCLISRAGTLPFADRTSASCHTGPEDESLPARPRGRPGPRSQ